MSVFPAHAGMSPGTGAFGVGELGFPRSRGDEPNGATSQARRSRFSPLTRG